MTIRRRLGQGLDAAREKARAPHVRRLFAIIQCAALLGVVAYLIVRLSEVGWSSVIAALPAAPLFYLIFFVRYFMLPLSEIPAYEIVWRRSLWRYFSAFLRKRVYNFAILGYSGEAFFTLWARRVLDLSDREILVGVKDNNLVSALVSNIATAILVAALFLTGRLRDGLAALPGSTFLFAIAFLTAFGLSIAVMIFRRRIMDLPPGVMSKLVAINSARMGLMLALHALLYWSALPGPALETWFVFIALQLVLSRVPFLPNLDIVFLTLALHFGALVDAGEAEIAGMLLAEAGLAQASNAALFLATAHLALKRRRTPETDVAKLGSRRAA